MTDETEVVVEIEKEAAAAPETTEVQIDKAPVKTEADPAIAELSKQYADLKKRDEAREAQLESERNAARQAREDAQRARQEAETARSEATDSQLGTVESGISAAKAEGEAARRHYKAAMEQGDFDAAGVAQEAIAEAAARRVRLEEARADIEARKAAPAKPEQRKADDPFEAFVSQHSKSAADWLRAHREWVTDPRKSAKLTAAHYDALDAGHSADSADYFEYVESQIGLRDKPASNGHDKDEVEVKAHTRQRRPAVPAAPVQNTGGGTSGGGRTVTLTRSEHAAATDGTLVYNYNDPSGQNKFKKGDPIGVQEFARRKLALQASGQYDKSYTEQ